MHMAETRSGAACWLALAIVGARRLSCTRRWGKCTNSSCATACPTAGVRRSTTAAPTLRCRRRSTHRFIQSRPRAPWPAGTGKRRGTRAGASPDGHYGNLFLFADLPEADLEPAAPPPWTPSQFLGEYLTFRSNWSPDAAYLCLNTRHSPTTSSSHDQRRPELVPHVRQEGVSRHRSRLRQHGELIGTVSAWCRGATNPFNQNMVVVDGQRPWSVPAAPLMFIPILRSPRMPSLPAPLTSARLP